MRNHDYRSHIWQAIIVHIRTTPNNVLTGLTNPAIICALQEKAQAQEGQTS